MPSLGLRFVPVLWVLGLGLWPPRAPDAHAAAPTVVFASIEPVAGLVESVGGGRIRVEVLVGPGASPVTYEPTARQLTRLSDAGLLFTIGVPFEGGLVPRLRAGMADLVLVPLGADGEESAPADAPSHAAHGDEDPHRWLDPLSVRAMVPIIAEALARTDPEDAVYYRERADALAAHWTAVHDELASRLSPVAGQTLLTYHPAYGAFARRFGLRQLAIEEHGREPGPRHLAEVLAAARHEGVRVLLVQPQHPRRSARAVARELGIPTVEIDPLARDVEATWRRLADVLVPEPGEETH